MFTTSVAHVDQVPTETRRHLQTLAWSYRWLRLCRCWESASGPLQPQQALSAAELSLQTLKSLSDRINSPFEMATRSVCFASLTSPRLALLSVRSLFSLPAHRRASVSNFSKWTVSVCLH